MYAGVDLGLKRSGVAVIKGCEMEFFTLKNEELAEFLKEMAKIVSVDAPLTYGEVWRDCDRAVFFANPMPLNLPTMRELMKAGIKLREKIENQLTIIESFTNGVKKILSVELEELGYEFNKEPSKHERDAGFLAFNSFLHRYGGTEAYGRECRIWLPMREVGNMVRQQADLKERVMIEKPGKVERVAGVDVHYKTKKAVAAAVVVKGRRVVDENITEKKVDFPYIPTLLALRELKPVLKALEGLDFDAIAVNAQGLGHIRLGLASHVGVLLDKPSLGITKKLVGGEKRGGEIWWRGRRVGLVRGHWCITIGHRFDFPALKRHSGEFIFAVERAHRLAKRLAF